LKGIANGTTNGDGGERSTDSSQIIKSGVHFDGIRDILDETNIEFEGNRVEKIAGKGEGTAHLVLTTSECE
jgi:hypothetical protein